MSWGIDEIYWYDLLGIIGGILAEVSKWYPKRRSVKTELAGIESLAWYFFLTTVMIFVGGFLVHIYTRTGIRFNDVLALNVGATAPLLLGLIAEKAPDLRPAPGP
jgi:hypothetical protein